MERWSSEWLVASVEWLMVKGVVEVKSEVRMLAQDRRYMVRKVSVGQEAGGKRASHSGGVDDRPKSVYEMITRRMLEELKEDLGEVKGRVNALLWLVAGATVLELLMRIVK